MDDMMKKIDLGEFNCFTRDFQIALPKSKISEIFKKVSISCQELEIPEFKSAVEMMGKEYSKEKLTEHRARLTELELFVKEMKIPRAYDNKYFSKDYEKKVLKVLDAQSIEYRKYIQNNLK